MSEPSTPATPTSPAEEPVDPLEPLEPQPKRKRGRPKGSKTKSAAEKTGDTTPRKRKARSASPPPGDWTPAKRAAFMDRIIANGYKATNLDELASELGLKRRQLVNQLAPGRKGSLRDKAVACAGDEGKNEAKREMKVKDEVEE